MGCRAVLCVWLIWPVALRFFMPFERGCGGLAGTRDVNYDHVAMGARPMGCSICGMLGSVVGPGNLQLVSTWTRADALLLCFRPTLVRR